MEMLSELTVKYRKQILIAFSLIIPISLFLSFMVNINYDLGKYLPEDMDTRISIDIMESQFGLSGLAQVMVENINIPQAIKLKERIKEVDGVKRVVWLDDYLDPLQPEECMDKAILEDFYNHGSALFRIEFEEDDYSVRTSDALDEIRAIVGEEAAMGGPAVSKKNLNLTTGREVMTIMLIAIPIFFIILLLSTSSWLEPVLFLAIMGVSVVINMGTNIFFNEISFMTYMTAAILQLAISMDYSIFLLHRFAEERNRAIDNIQAMKNAIARSFSPIAASCLTTVAGFIALMFMRYKIGLDMGSVLAKGIILSMLCVVLLLPALALLLNPLLEATRHPSFIPSFKGFGRIIIKQRFLITGLLLLLAVPSFFAQSSNSFLYGEESVSNAEGTMAAAEQQRITDKFGIYNPLILMIPSGDVAKENLFTGKLEALEHIKSVQGLSTLADPAIPREMLPQDTRDYFQSDEYTRIVVEIDAPSESPEAFEAVNGIKCLAAEYYDSYYIVGSSSSIMDIKEVVETDYTIVNLVSITIISLIILFTFKSLTLPLILVFVIETSIWINMSIPYFMGTQLAFIGYMIISAVQLGATIDYAILMCSRYMENRLSMDKRTAAVRAVSDSTGSILTSAGILCGAGLTVGLVSTVRGISELGILIGRGAAISSMLVMIVLPQLLVIFDSIIMRTTLLPKVKNNP